MKQFCAVFLAFLLLSLSVCADSLNDPCTSNQSTTTRETYNLVSANPLFSTPGYTDLADTSALTVQNPAQYGEIISRSNRWTGFRSTCTVETTPPLQSNRPMVL